MKAKMVDLNNFTALILLKVKSFQDSYSLTKVLAWKFGIINVSEITEKLKEEKLIISTIEKGISKYEITNKGLRYIEANKDEGKQLLLEQYKSEQSFVESLFI
jgi:DNA-binding PadR family transcriptional regulator